MGLEGPTPSPEAQAQHRQNIGDARKIVDGLINDDKVPPPTKTGYVVDDVVYDPSAVRGESGRVLAGKHTPVPGAINSATITIYPRGSATLREAIVTYGHELGHFNPAWTERIAESYGQNIYNVYGGGEYGGPRPR